MSEEKKLTLFKFQESGVREITIDGEPWFVGKDVATILGYGDTNQAIRKHVDSDDKLSRRFDVSGQGRNMAVINESGLYSLIISSKLPTAKKFKHWVTNEVLPTIRKTGKYDTQPDYYIPQNYAEALQLAADQTKKLLVAKPKADYFDLQMKNPGLLTTTVIAKAHGMTAHKLNMLLNKYHIIYKRGKTWVPYKEYEDKGYCDYENWSNQENQHVTPLLKWTQKGEKLIHDLLEKHGIKSQAKKFNYGNIERNIEL